MDRVFEESEFKFDFSNSINVQKADDGTYHDLSAVDFVVETAENYVFIEVKNPDDSRAKEENKSKFLSDLQNAFFPYVAADKFKNMLMRKWASENDYEKPILCVYILEFSNFAKTERARLKEKIFNRIPFSLNKTEFGGRPIFEKRFELLNIEEFRQAFPAFTVEAM